MENKDHQRNALAVLIISLLFFIYLDKILLPYLNPTPAKNSTSENVEEAKVRENKGTEATLNEVKKEESVSSQISQTLDKQVAPKEDELILDKVLVSSPLFDAEISKKGGRVISFKLKNFKENDIGGGQAFNMISHKPGTPYPGGVFLDEESDIAVNYQVSIESSAAAQSDNNQLILSDENKTAKIVLKGKMSGGEEVQKVFAFSSDQYLYSVSASVPKQSKKLSFQWLNQISAKEAGELDSYNVIGFVWLIDDLAHRLPFAEMKEGKEKSRLSCAKWVGLGNKYFASAVISEDSFLKPETTTGKFECAEGTLPSAEIKREDDLAVLRYSPPQSENAESKIELKIFSGPKAYGTLGQHGFELKRLIDLGKTGFISAPLLSFLNFLNRFVNNYGLSIVLLTICVKLCLYPLNTSQYRQMKAMQSLKPEMDKIRDNIKDKQQQQAAMMELYKKKGVNPLGGCLPALVQMPIFIGLYSALMLAVELRHAQYGLWVHDLSAPDRLMVGGIGIPVLVVLFTGSIMVQQWITPTTVDPAQKKAMMIMPLVMFFMFMNFPAGLALYWLTNNLISIGQQEAIKYGDKSGKSGLGITIGVAAVVFFIAYLGTLF